MIVAGFVGDVLRGENPDKLTSYYDVASSDDIQIVKLYPEGCAEARFKIRGVRRILFYCNRDDLFMIDPLNI